MAKVSRIGFWTVTAIFCLQIAFTAYAQLTLPQVAGAFAHLGFPDYFRIELAWAKLLGVVLLVESRVVTDQDRQTIAWLRSIGRNPLVVATKADKLKRGPAKAALLEVRRQLAELHPTATVQLFSALTPSGADEARTILDHWLEFPTEDA